MNPLLPESTAAASRTGVALLPLVLLMQELPSTITVGAIAARTAAVLIVEPVRSEIRVREREMMREWEW